MSQITETPPLLAEGKTKVLTQHPAEPTQVYVRFKDRATAFNAAKTADVPGKGAMNAAMTAHLFAYLAQQGIASCYVGPGRTPDELVYQKLTMIPLEVVVRNVAYGSLCQRYSQFQSGQPLSRPVVEFFLKTDSDPLIAEDVAHALGILPSGVDFAKLRRQALVLNDLLVPFFQSLGIVCADFKLEFGVSPSGALLLADELSPDNFRLRDANTGDILDKDVFRLDQGDLAQTYQRLLDRLKASPSSSATREGTLKQCYEAQLVVRYRQSVLHPESRAILESLHSLGYANVQSLQAGKHFQLTIESEDRLQATRQVEALAEAILSNPVIEDFECVCIEPVEKERL
ncbi:MAG: phosphoribosylformylglycinamidine synthase subunit PurS [Candidatus Melainabacteria bacterium]|nr:phosphoribosylformylglycinamidine synthase subunit PurS [Candidatus Melainabacteria bacterium]